jgi:hypothetical protein
MAAPKSPPSTIGAVKVPFGDAKQVYKERGA